MSQEYLDPAMQEVMNDVDTEEEFSTNVDFCFVIDITASMQPSIDNVKEIAKGFYPEVEKMLKENNRKIDECRVKVIGFRDFYCDGPYALEESDFFELPAQEAELNDFINGLEAKGGGDDPENGLEALALAMQSNWNPVGEHKRHIIVLFTDQTAHPLEKAATVPDEKKPAYPENMPQSYGDILAMWEGVDNGSQGNAMGIVEPGAFGSRIDKRARRLVLFTPDADPWNEVKLDFNQANSGEIKPDGGGNELEAKKILYNFIGKSIA